MNPPHKDKGGPSSSLEDISSLPREEGAPTKSYSNTNHCRHNINNAGGRNLVVNLDGTSNKFGSMNTNVIELYSMLDKDDNQLTWYNSGVGTYVQPSWKSLAYWRTVIHNKIDFATSREFDKTIMEAYQWLSENYRTGDRIFLFGFSRGALQIRVLSAMIEKVGLIHKGNEKQIPFAYKLYADPSTAELQPKDEEEKHQRMRRQSQDMEEIIPIAERFKRTFSHTDVKVHFVGVWDTVSSIGVFGGRKKHPGTVDGMKHVCYFRHALALDERRVKFLPEFAYGAKGIPPEDLADELPRIKEVWFPGTHSEIGGRNVQNTQLNRARLSLRWMIFEAGSLGLSTKPFTRYQLPKDLTGVKDSLTWIWWPLELIPLRRPTYSRRPNGRTSTFNCHWGKPRKIQPGQKIHASLSFDPQYTPKASPPPGNINFWKNVQGAAHGIRAHGRSALHEIWVELDLYDHVIDAFQELIRDRNAPLDTLLGFSRRNDGKRTLYEAIMDILADSAIAFDVKENLTERIISLLDTDSFAFGKRNVIDVLPNLFGCPIKEATITPITKDYISKLCQMLPRRILVGHKGSVSSVVFSPDGQKLISGSWDSTIRIWNADTGVQIGDPLTGHKYWVSSIDVSPDGKHIVSGAEDKTLRLWDLEKSKQVGDAWTGHTNDVKSVAFSPDGQHVVSGSYDKSVRLWDVNSGTQIGYPWTGHQAWVWCVAYSPDGGLVASASLDKEVRVSNSGIHESNDVRLKHKDMVLSVSFSPDGKKIASGAVDGTILLWDAEIHEQVGEPFLGHKSWVRSLCFSPDGKLLVSGSSDQAIRIWDVDTGLQIGEPLGGHDGWVNCVAISPDGRKLASASRDSTIRIWDIEDYVAWARL